MGTTLLDIPFDADQIDLDDIVPSLETTITQDQLEILNTRFEIGMRLFNREEWLAMADVHAANAAEMEAKAADATGISEIERRRIASQARQARCNSTKFRWRARHTELEILTHLQRKQG